MQRATKKNSAEEQSPEKPVEFLLMALAYYKIIITVTILAFAILAYVYFAHSRNFTAEINLTNLGADQGSIQFKEFAQNLISNPQTPNFECIDCLPDIQISPEGNWITITATSNNRTALRSYLTKLSSYILSKNIEYGATKTAARYKRINLYLNRANEVLKQKVIAYSFKQDVGKLAEKWPSAWAWATCNANIKLLYQVEWVGTEKIYAPNFPLLCGPSAPAKYPSSILELLSNYALVQAIYDVRTSLSDQISIENAATTVQIYPTHTFIRTVLPKTVIILLCTYILTVLFCLAKHHPAMRNAVSNK